MDKKKLEIAAAAILIIIFVLILIGSLKKTGQKMPVPSKAVSPALLPANIKPIAETKNEKKPDVKDEETDLGRDPFALPEVKRGPASAVSGLNLAGITTNGAGKAIAIINENMVSVGGKIGYFTVVDITSNRVILTDGTQNYELTLKQ